MRAQTSLVSAVSPEPLLSEYTKYGYIPELIWLARLYQHELLMDPRCLLICDEYQNLTCWSNIYLSSL